MTLDILIPTYNRSEYLKKNLALLCEMIREIRGDEISILVSDNGSPDDTSQIVEEIKEDNKDIDIRYYRQKSNLGPLKNILFLLSNSTGDYVMYLGDDDFISTHYLNAAIKSLNEDEEIKCILPAFEAIDEEGNTLGWGRDLGKQTKLYSPGIESVKQNGGRAHQISGIILKRDGLNEAVAEVGITNLYPQIFLTAYSCLNGKCKHIPEYPVLVTQTGKKAWSYDDIGLLGDIFENYKALNLSSKDQFSLEKEMIRSQQWRAFRYQTHPIKQLNVIRKITFHKNTSKVGKVFLGPYLTFLWAKRMATEIIKRIKK